MDRSLRITCVICDLGPGGAQRNILRLADWLSRAGHIVTLVTTHAAADFFPVPETITRLRAPDEAALSCRWCDLVCQARRRTALRTALLETAPDIVVSFIDTTNISVLMALRGERIPVIVSERVDPRYHPIGWRWTLLRRLHYPRAAKVVMMADETLLWALSRWPGSSVCAIPNPVCPVLASADERPVWFGARNIVALGRLAKQKGFDMLLQAFGDLASRFMDWNLTIIGEGEERDALEQLIRRLRLSNRVHLSGTIDDPCRIMVHGDLFVLSSRYEGFPNALVEAMACGLPVVSFACPTGPAEIIEHGVNGMLVPRDDVAGLRDAMTRLMEHEETRRKIASRAKDILNAYSLERVMGMWERVVHEALQVKHRCG